VDRDAIDPFFVTAYYTANAHHGACEGRANKGIPVLRRENGFARFALHTSRSFRTNQYSLLSGTMVG